MKHLLLMLMIALMMSSCAAPLDLSTTAPSTKLPGKTVGMGFTPTPGALSTLQQYLPQNGDKMLETGTFFLDEASLLVLESFPVQVNLLISGNLPTPCHQFRFSVAEPDAKNRIVVELYTVVDPNLICIQVLEPIEATLPLGSFPSGHYSVWVNGILAGEFDS